MQKQVKLIEGAGPQSEVSSFASPHSVSGVSDLQSATAPVMNRRRFLTNAGMTAAGLALCGPSLGCSDVSYTYIPCLGPAAAPVPVPGMTYIRASEIGCALDCSLYDGRNKHNGGSATDDASRINAAMAAASESHPITLIIDGSALISGLFLPAGGHWSIAGLGCGTGFFVKDGTNNDGIHNGPSDAGVPGDPGPPAPPRGANVSLSNFTLNGNRGNGHRGNSTTGKAQGTDLTWYVGVNLMNLDNIRVENVVVVNTPAYHFRFANVGNVTVSGCVMQSSGPSTDGLHFDGPANDIVITKCDFTTGDDAIALNCPEGYSGDISRVTVTNCKFKSFALMRLMTINSWGSIHRFNIDTVSVTNCSGTLEQAGFLIGATTGSNPDSVTGLTVSDCALTAPALLEIGASFGTIALNNVILTAAGSNQAAGYALLRTTKFFWAATYIGSYLSVNNCFIQRTADKPVTPVMVEFNSVIKIIEFNGFGIRDPRPYPKAPNLVTVASGSIGQLTLNTVDSTLISAAALSGEFSSIGSVDGAGVLATGWAFPDSVMANGVPYISASTGAASIKLDGVVQPYAARFP